MNGRDLLAIVADPGPGLAALWPDHVIEGRFAAILTVRRMMPRMSRKAAARAAFERQSALESLMGHGTVLPALPGTPLRTTDAAAAIRANQTLLDRQTERLRGNVQFQLQIAYDQAAAPQWIGAGPGDVKARIRQCVTERADAALAGLGADSLGLPLAESLALNRALLIRQDQEADLDEAVERIDALWSAGLAIRLVGPSPAVSFASIGLKRFGAAEVAAAFARLGLSHDADGGAIKAASRAAILAAPGDASALRAASAIASTARQSGTGIGPVHQMFIWSEDQSAPDAAINREVA